MDAMNPAGTLDPATLAQLTFDAASRHGLPVPLVRAIVQVESGGNPWAYRFEPDFLARYVEPTPRRFGAVSVESERFGRATSWGLMQVMGQVARERGCDAAFLSALCEPRLGLEYGCRQLSWLRDRYLARWGWDGVTAAYNAGSPRVTPDGRFVNQAYVDRVRREQSGI